MMSESDMNRIMKRVEDDMNFLAGLPARKEEEERLGRPWGEWTIQEMMAWMDRALPLFAEAPPQN